MAYAVSDLKNELTGVFHGTTLNKITGLDLVIDRAAKKILNSIDPLETIKIEQLPTIYDDVFDYSISNFADLKGDRVIDIRPQVRRELFDGRFTQTYNEEFDLYKRRQQRKGEFTIQYDNATKSIRIARNDKLGILVNDCDSLTANGTWAVTAPASNLTLDTLNFIQGSASLNFDLDSGANPSTGFIQNSTMRAIDLSEHEDIATEFVDHYIPDASLVTALDLRWGSSTSDYWNRTVTAPFFGDFQNGWNLLGFDWNGATVTGSPDSSAINFIRVSDTYNGTADTDYRLDQIISRVGKIFEVEYYSKFMFRDATTGVFQEKVTDDSNIINLDTEGYNLMFDLTAYFAAQQIQGVDSGFDVAFFKNEWEEERRRYTAKNKSQVIKPQQRYYTMPPKMNTRRPMKRTR